MDYDEIYRNETAPWEIGGPQPALAAVIDSGAVRGPAVLDLGCGTGELALTLARRGFQVTGVDLSAVAIAQAGAKAAAAGLTVDLRVGDALELSAGPFDAVFDSGLLHNLHRHGGADRYLALLPGLAAPGATVFVLAVSVWGLTEDYLRAGFAGPHWTGTEITGIEVAATVGPIPGFLMRTFRAGYRDVSGAAASG